MFSNNPLNKDIPSSSRLDSLSSDSPSPSEVGKRKLKAVERGVTACSECRRHKIRCHPALDDPEHLLPCQRCLQKSLSCQFLKHRRGRKKRATDNGSVGRMDQVDPALQDVSVDYPSETLGPIPVRISRFPFLASSRTSNIRTNNDSAVASDSARMSLRSMLESGGELPQVSDGPGNGQMRSTMVGDPVQLGFISLEDARALFSLFVLRFNRAMSLLDPYETHDHIKNSSSFLYTAILCISSRYLSFLPSHQHFTPPESALSAHQRIVVLARDHLTWAFADAASSLDVVRAIAILSMWKEPDDDKPGFYFNRAVLLGKELGLGRIPSVSERLSPQNTLLIRIKQRVWLNMFMASTVYHLQFNQPLLIDHFDPLVVNCHHWLRNSRPETVLMDTLLCCSVDLRRKCLHYRSLLQTENPSALSLSVLTRTMNDDWDITFEGWANEIISVAGGNDTHIRKARVWASGLQLNLNLIIVNQSLRIPPGQRLEPVSSPSPNLTSIPAFHHCINAATTLLIRVEALDREDVSYASDTLLHFSLYAATLLWTLCRTPQLCAFTQTEITHCQGLILKTADALASASIYSSDSPSLHARYLRRLCGEPIHAHDPYDEQGVQSHGPSQMSIPLDPVDQFENNGIDLDVLLADFPWTGLDPPWNQLDGLWLGNEGDWEVPS